MQSDGEFALGMLGVQSETALLLLADRVTRQSTQQGVLREGNLTQKVVFANNFSCQ